MEEKILEILKETLELERVDEACSQQTCPAWDSMGQLNIVAELEEAFGIELEPEEIASMHSYNDIVALLKGKGV
ncbi:MAG: acyl carrier protein [Bacteroidaceae bacterium]|nr:acyl carrier protein [Bacteroidaceae bacterium]